MIVFDWFQDEKGRYFYCPQKIGTTIAVIRHCIAQHPPEEVVVVVASSSNPRVGYKILKFRIQGYDLYCKPEKITPVTKAPTVGESFLCKK